MKYFAVNIESIDRNRYEKLQAPIRRHLREVFDRGICAVQYDDIRWWALNREGAPCISGAFDFVSIGHFAGDAFHL